VTTPLSLLISNGLLFGAVLSLLLVALMLGSLAVAPDIWVNDSPPDIREKYGPNPAWHGRDGKL